MENILQEASSGYENECITPQPNINRVWAESDFERPDNTESRSTAKSRLENLSSREIDRLIYINTASFITALLSVIVGITLSYTGLSDVSREHLENGDRIDVPGMKFKGFTLGIQGIFLLPQTLWIWILTVGYWCMVVVGRCQIMTDDQKMMSVQLLVWSICQPAGFWFVYVHDQLLVDRKNEAIHIARKIVKWINIISMVQMSASICIIFMLMIWIRAHKLGCINRSFSRWQKLNFYFPKVTPCFIHQGIRMYALSGHKIVTGLYPFETLIICLKTHRYLPHPHIPSIATATALTLIEIYIFVCIITRTLKTRKVLRNLSYMEHRSRHVCFKFFVFHNTIYFFSIVGFTCILAAALPSGTWLSTIRSEGLYVYLNLYFVLGIFLMLTSYVTINAYVTLPPTPIQWFRWLHNKDKSKKLAPPEPIMFASDSTSSPTSTFFPFNTQVCMFNFASLAYDIKKPDCPAPVHPSPFQYSVQAEIVHEESDTHVIVFVADKKIILAFRGTVSLDNIKTDLRMALTSLQNVLPTRQCDDYLEKSVTQSILWKRACIHSGFSRAYKAISNSILAQVETLLQSTCGQVYLTGHSLGGALATICSFDIIASGLASSRDVIVTTFGSPKCGNYAWSRLCDTIVPIHWRVAISTDLVTTMPRPFYSHCGKLALISQPGTIFLDPNALDHRIWGGEVYGFRDHKRPSYELALRSFHFKNTPTVDSPFSQRWTFNADDKKRWNIGMLQQTSYAV